MSGTSHFVGNLERIWIEGNENGWELCFETEHGTYVTNAHGIAHAEGLHAQLGEIVRELDRWWNEGKQAAREHGVDLYRSPTSGRVLDDPPLDGYDSDDPKSPGYHDRMVGDA